MNFKIGDKVRDTEIYTVVKNAENSELMLMRKDGTVFSAYDNHIELVKSFEELVIEAGKFYQPRIGYKCRVFVTDSKIIYKRPVFAEFEMNDSWYAIALTPEGKSVNDSFDIIGPWTDRPQIDWASMPKWAKAVWRCENIWKGSGEIPRWDCTVQGYTFPRYTADVFYIPIEYYPTFSGSDKDSLVVREEE